MSINDLYISPEYAGVLYYLSERGFSKLEDLAAFDFDELFFVPGLSEETIEAAKELFLNAKDRPDDPSAESEDHESGTNDLAEAVVTEAVLSQTIEACCEAMQQAIGRFTSAEGVKKKRETILSTYEDHVDLVNLLAICDEIESYYTIKSVAAQEAEKKRKEALIEALSGTPIESAFKEISRGSAMITYCRKNGISTLAQLIDFDFDNTKIHGLGKSSMEACKTAYQQTVHSIISGPEEAQTAITDEGNIPMTAKSAVDLSPDLGERFRKAYYELDARARESLLRKAKGETLQEIGDHLGITRERVRQIINKSIRKIRRSCSGLLRILTNDGKDGFYTPDIKTVLPDADELECFAYVIKESDKVCYLSYADKYVPLSEVPKDFNGVLSSVGQEMIGDIVNYYNIIDDVEEHLHSRGISFLDALEFMGYLMENGYRAIGDYVVRRQSTYKRICYAVIEEHFKNGIKLDSDPNNEDINRLKEIVKAEFSGFEIEQSNRALTARLTPDLILCGRGRYIAEENVVYDEALFEEIADYINASKEPSFYYSELFAAFSGRLYAETSVDNANYLHGMLKYFYPDSYRYERDMLVKIGKERVTFADRLSQMIREKGKPVSKAEIVSAFPGVTDIRIANAMVLDPRIIQWEYNQYNHMDNVQWDQSDLKAISDALESIASVQSGYCSEKNLYDRVCKTAPEFIRKNDLQSSQNVFYITSFLLRGKYRFSRPHIANRSFPNIDLNNIEVAKHFLRGKTTLDYRELVKMSETLGWANGTFTMILNAVEKDYVKIDLNNYIIKEQFSLESDSLERIGHELDLLTRENGYYGIFAVFSFDRFPEVGYEWNEHLLQSIIESYPVGYKILEPKMRDRRYRRGIIVPEENACMSYEDLIISQMRKDGISRIEKDEFCGYLRRKGLVMTANIPIELYEGDGVRLEGSFFVC